MSKLSYLLLLLLMLTSCKSRAGAVRQQHEQLQALTELRDTLRIRWWSDGSVAELPQLRRYPLPRRLEGDSTVPDLAPSGEALVTRHTVLEAREEASHATQETQLVPAPEKRPSHFLAGLWTGVAITLALLLVIRLLRRYLRRGIL